MRVSESLYDLILSGKQYAPAIALARHKIKKIKYKEFSDYRLIEAEYSGILRDLLSSQKSDGYFLAESKVDEIGYISRGTFCWIVGCTKE